MIFWTWRSYFICWQIFENKVWCPVSKKRRKYFHFLLSLAYPIDRLDWALFSVVILFHHLFPLLEKVEIRAFILPRNFPAVLIIFTGRGGAGNPPLPTATPLHAGRQCWGKTILPGAGYGLGTYRTVDIFNFSHFSLAILEKLRFLCFYIIKSIARKGYFGPKYP